MTEPTITLFVRGCTDPWTGGLLDIGVQEGMIAFVEEHIPNKEIPYTTCEVVEGEGWVALPGLIETHIHLDKAFLAERMSGSANGVSEAIAMTAELKKTYTLEDIIVRSRRVLDRAIRFGTTLLRAHVEVDPIIGLMSMEAAVKVREEYDELISQQLVIFPQEGIFRSTGTSGLMKEAVKLGADAVGGVPYNDRDSDEHLEFVFRLAESTGLPIDLHLDFSDDPQQLAIQEVISLTRRFGMQGRVAVGHLTSLGSVEPDIAKRISADIASVGISVLTLPATDLYLNGRGDTHRVRRGLTPVHILLEEGVNVCFGTNNMRNAFTPSGTGDPLDMALLLSRTQYMGTEKDATTLLNMCTGAAAIALGMNRYGLRAGCPADFVLIHASSALDVIYDKPVERKVWKHGKLIRETEIVASH
jgi:cytosine deaminase